MLYNVIGGGGEGGRGGGRGGGGGGMHMMTLELRILCASIVTFGLCTHRDPVVLSSSFFGDFLFLLAAAQMTMLLKSSRQRCFV